MDEAAIERMTFTYFPDPMIRDLLRSAFISHKDSGRRMDQEFAPPEQEYLGGHDRRARLEQFMRAVGDRHDIPHEVKRGIDGLGCFHTELSNGPVLLTAASVQYPRDMVDPAEYRLSLARDDQMQFEQLEDEQPADGRLYILLIHSRSRFPNPQEQRDYGYLPGSVYLAYPNDNLTAYRHWINLFDRYPDVVKAETPKEWDDEQLTLFIERSRRVYVPRHYKRN